MDSSVFASSSGHALDMSPQALGELRPSDDVAARPEVLRERMAEDGYLYLPGYLDRSEVLAARRDLLARLLAAGRSLDDPDLAELGPDPKASLGPTVDGNGTGLNTHPSRSALLQRLLYSGRMIEFYERYFGEPVLHFTYTWLRANRPGPGTPPHMDSVFMNRGTPRLLTAWTPLGDIDRTLGGLAILEGSHRLDDIVNDYAGRDVDTYCVNPPDSTVSEETRGDRLTNGYLHDDATQLRRQLGRRWLTADFQAGDLVTFTMHTAHIGLDNNTPDRIRLSCDSRYQPAAEPADHRWVGPDPQGHGPQSKRGLIC